MFRRPRFACSRWKPNDHRPGWLSFPMWPKRLSQLWNVITSRSRTKVIAIIVSLNRQFLSSFLLLIRPNNCYQKFEWFVFGNCFFGVCATKLEWNQKKIFLLHARDSCILGGEVDNTVYQWRINNSVRDDSQFWGFFMFDWISSSLLWDTFADQIFEAIFCFNFHDFSWDLALWNNEKNFLTDLFLVKAKKFLLAC